MASLSWKVTGQRGATPVLPLPQFPPCAGKWQILMFPNASSAVVTHHIQLLPDGDHINSTAALSDAAVMSLPV